VLQKIKKKILGFTGGGDVIFVILFQIEVIRPMGTIVLWAKGVCPAFFIKMYVA